MTSVEVRKPVPREILMDNEELILPNYSMQKVKVEDREKGILRRGKR